MVQNGSDKFQVSIFKQIIWIVGFVAVTNIIGNLFTGYPMVANIKWVVVIIAAYITDEIGLNFKDQEKVMFTFIAVLVYTIFPLGWYNSGLVSNNALAYLFLFVIASTLLFDGGRRIFLLMSISILFVVFMVVEQFYPQLLPVHDQVILFRDRMIQIPLVVLITATMLIQFTNALKSKHEAVRLLSEENIQLSYKDHLTGLGNRKYIIECVGSLVEEQRNFHTLMMRLDNFKIVNSSFGYEEGDAILQSVGSILITHLPKGSYISRFGGDEFMVVMPQEQLYTRVVINTLINAFNGEELLTRCGITVSGACGAFISGASVGEHLSRVEQMVYESKSMGKNQILIDKGVTDERKSM